MCKPLVTEIVRHPGGTKEKKVPLDEVEVPDLWPIVKNLRRMAEDGADGALSKDADDIQACWSLCHDLLKTLRGGGHGPVGQG
jgi:hypothetical protein